MGASLPALLPKGITFINKLSREYRALCDQKNIEYIPFRITSATRTIKSVKALMKDNGNAIENSAHLKGKTIDITYLTSKKHTKQKELFIQTLAKLKDQGLCYVKFEVKMKCLHITWRRFLYNNRLTKRHSGGIRIVLYSLCSLGVPLYKYRRWYAQHQML